MFWFNKIENNQTKIIEALNKLAELNINKDNNSKLYVEISFWGRKDKKYLILKFNTEWKKVNKTTFVYQILLDIEKIKELDMFKYVDIRFGILESELLSNEYSLKVNEWNNINSIKSKDE